MNCRFRTARHEDFKNRCKDGFFESLTERDTAFVIHGGSIMAIMQKLLAVIFMIIRSKTAADMNLK